MSYLTACQPGWLAVFANPNGDGFSTEPIACWMASNEDVKPVCALGGDVCDASTVENFVGVVAPNGNAAVLYAAWRAKKGA